MPTISRFYGMTVYMNYRQHDHNPPHIHVTYGNGECLIDLRTCSVIAGKIPPRATGLAVEWTLKNRERLLEMWETQNFETLPPLD